MSGQSAVMSHSEAKAKALAIEYGPNKTTPASSDPNAHSGTKAMNVEVPCGTLHK